MSRPTELHLRAGVLTARLHGLRARHQSTVKVTDELRKIKTELLRGECGMKVSRVMRKRSMKVLKIKTSIALEPIFWTHLQRMAGERDLPLNQFVSQVALSNRKMRLVSALRLAVLNDIESELARRNGTPLVPDNYEDSKHVYGEAVP